MTADRSVVGWTVNSNNNNKNDNNNDDDDKV